MKNRFIEWDNGISSIEEAVEGGRATVFTEMQARRLYDEIRQRNNEAVEELNALNAHRTAVREAVFFPGIREYIAECRIHRKHQEISMIAAYDARADKLKDSVAAKQRRYG